MPMLNAGIVVVSDRAWLGQRHDESGMVIKECISQIPLITIVEYEIVPDEREVISAKLKEWVDEREFDLIITTGGTGLSPRDVTPEATLAVIDKVVPGLGEAMRMETMKITPEAMLSRAVVGMRGKCLIINLPGSPKGVRECLEVVLPVLPHALDVIGGKIMEGAHGGNS